MLPDPKRLTAHPSITSKILSTSQPKMSKWPTRHSSTKLSVKLNSKVSREPPNKKLSKFPQVLKPLNLAKKRPSFAMRDPHQHSLKVNHLASPLFVKQNLRFQLQFWKSVKRPLNTNQQNRRNKWYLVSKTHLSESWLPPKLIMSRNKTAVAVKRNNQLCPRITHSISHRSLVRHPLRKIRLIHSTNSTHKNKIMVSPLSSHLKRPLSLTLHQASVNKLVAITGSRTLLSRQRQLKSKQSSTVYCTQGLELQLAPNVEVKRSISKKMIFTKLSANSTLQISLDTSHQPSAWSHKRILLGNTKSSCWKITAKHRITDSTTPHLPESLSWSNPRAVSLTMTWLIETLLAFTIRSWPKTLKSTRLVIRWATQGRLKDRERVFWPPKIPTDKLVKFCCSSRTSSVNSSKVNGRSLSSQPPLTTPKSRKLFRSISATTTFA